MRSLPPRLVAVVAPLLAVLATLVVLGGIPGGLLRRGPHDFNAPPIPEDVGDRRGRLEVTVRAAPDGAPLERALVRVYSIVEGRAYLGGDGTTDPLGHVAIPELPAGEHWVVADADGRARGSSSLVLAPEETRALELALGPEHRLELIVRDETGAPIPGAEVEVGGGAGVPVGARTGVDGRVTVGRLAPAPWHVRARAAGFEEGTRTVVREGGAEAITLARLGALVVHVVDEHEDAVPGARVELAGATLWPARSATTEGDGHVRVGGLRAGSYAVRARHGDRVSPIELGIGLDRGEEKTITLRLEPGRFVAVYVVSGDEEDAPPIAGANVTLAEGGVSPFPIQGRTDRDGRLRLGPIAPGGATLSAHADGHVARGGIPVPSGAEPVRVALVRAGVLTGRVVDARGFPIDGATIEIVGTDFYGAPISDDPRRARFRAAHFEATLEGPAPLLPAGELGVMPGPVPPIPRGTAASLPPLTDRLAAASLLAEPWVTRGDGTFRAAPATPGRVRVVAHHPQYVEAFSDTVTLTPGGEASVEIVMRSGGTLEGRVVDATDHPVAGARVLLAGMRSSLERSTTTAGDGTFGFASVPEEVTLSVSASDDPIQVATRLTVSVPEGGKKELTIRLPEPRGPLPVTVRDDRGYPVANVQVTVTSLEPSVPFRATTFTDARGEATLQGAKGIALRVEAFAPGRAPASLSLDRAATEIALTLAASESATGEVRSTRGDPIAGADVTLYTELGTRHARTNDQGTFAIADLAPGKARLRVRAAGFAPVERALSIPSSRGDRPYAIPRVELAAEGKVEGIVVDGRGDPVPGARVARDRVPTYLAVGRTPAGVAVTDSKGRFVLAELPEGSTTLEAYAADLGWARVDVKVVAGRTTSNVRIAIQRAAEGPAPDPTTAGNVAVTLGEASAEREVVLVSVVEGSEAERAGLLPGDVVLEVDGAPVHTIEEARARLGGPLGDDVVVRLRRGDKVESIRVARERVRR